MRRSGLVRRLGYTIGLLGVSRLGLGLTAPGSHRSIFALGLWPLIASALFVQLLGVVSLPVTKLQGQGSAGHQKLTQYTRSLAVLLTIASAAVLERGFLAAVTLTAGAALLWWLGEQITEQGVGNGFSLLLATNVLAPLPRVAWRLGTEAPRTLIAWSVMLLGAVAVTLFLGRAQRRITVEAPKRLSPQPAPVSLAISSSVLPFFFAQALAMPLLGAHADPWISNGLVMGLTAFFVFFCTPLWRHAAAEAARLREAGAWLPGLRPGAETATAIERIHHRVNVAGAAFLVLFCCLPPLVFEPPLSTAAPGVLIVVSSVSQTLSDTGGLVPIGSKRGTPPT